SVHANNKEEKSLGTRITTERIEVMNKLNSTNATVHISNKEKGVKAEVILPLELSF
ncbi:MAG: hypothetical protein JO072_01690, partial [Parafilimonas sp.]|nr:hypothetical protein [Parafilimonas sp.]